MKKYFFYATFLISLICSHDSLQASTFDGDDRLHRTDRYTFHPDDYDSYEDLFKTIHEDYLKEDENNPVHLSLGEKEMRSQESFNHFFRLLRDLGRGIKNLHIELDNGVKSDKIKYIEEGFLKNMFLTSFSIFKLEEVVTIGHNFLAGNRINLFSAEIIKKVKVPNYGFLSYNPSLETVDFSGFEKIEGTQPFFMHCTGLKKVIVKDGDKFFLKAVLEKEYPNAVFEIQQ